MTGTSTSTNAPAPTAGSRCIRAQLDALFPDTDGNTTFNAIWKDDVSQHPHQYPQIMQVLNQSQEIHYG